MLGKPPSSERRIMRMEPIGFALAVAGWAGVAQASANIDLLSSETDDLVNDPASVQRLRAACIFTDDSHEIRHLLFGYGANRFNDQPENPFGARRCGE